MSIDCPIPGCLKDAADNELLCRPHWSRVPTALKMELWKRSQELRNWNPASLKAFEAARSHAMDACWEAAAFDWIAVNTPLTNGKSLSLARRAASSQRAEHGNDVAEWTSPEKAAESWWELHQALELVRSA